MNKKNGPNGPKVLGSTRRRVVCRQIDRLIAIHSCIAYIHIYRPKIYRAWCRRLRPSPRHVYKCILYVKSSSLSRPPPPSTFPVMEARVSPSATHSYTSICVCVCCTYHIKYRANEPYIDWLNCVPLCAERVTSYPPETFYRSRQ